MYTIIIIIIIIIIIKPYKIDFVFFTHSFSGIVDVREVLFFLVTHKVHSVLNCLCYTVVKGQIFKDFKGHTFHKMAYDAIM